jgi:hypothetical protein
MDSKCTIVQLWEQDKETKKEVVELIKDYMKKPLVRTLKSPAPTTISVVEDLTYIFEKLSIGMFNLANKSNIERAAEDHQRSRYRVNNTALDQNYKSKAADFEVNVFSARTKYYYCHNIPLYIESYYQSDYSKLKKYIEKG